MKLLTVGRVGDRYEKSKLNTIMRKIEQHSRDTDSPLSQNFYASNGTTATVTVGTVTTTSSDAVLAQLIADMRKRGFVR